jgi:hypothetical protein
VFLTKAAFDVFEALFEQETDMDEDKFFGLLGVRDYIRKRKKNRVPPSHFYI